MYKYDVRECSNRLSPWIIRTPLVESDVLSQLTGRKVFLKLESLQRTGAFKFRGALNYLLSLDKETAAMGVMTASSGNHGLGMSLGAQLLGLKCTVVMPKKAPLVKQNKAKSYGARVVLEGNSYDEAATYAQQLAIEEKAAYVPSFNHPAIIEGQATAMVEMYDEQPELDAILTPVGGGGMISGLLIGREQLGAKAEIIAVEPTGAASMHAAVQAGQVISIPDMNTYADGVAVAKVGDHNFAVVKLHNPAFLQVTDEEIRHAQRLLLTEAKVITESAGAVAVAGLLKAELPPEIKQIACVITGANVDPEGLKQLL